VVGAIVAAMRRPVDLVARYGGEEFAVVLPMTSEEVAKERGEEACRAVRALNIVHPGLERGAIVTVSVGVAGGQLPVAPADLIRAADEMLYKAKSLGRNCVVARD
jgi:diguanylate cyclase (GGDEF)-like protein